MRAAPGLYPVREISANETQAAFLVLAGPYGVEPEDLEEAEQLFVDRVNNVLRPEGYRLAGAFPPESEIASGVVGFRLVRSNAWGDHLWIDDLIAAGVGAQSEILRLLRFLKDEARNLGVAQIHLDVVPPELADGPKQAPRRSFGREVESLAKLIEGDPDYKDEDDGIDPDSPLGNRICAAEHGFLYVGQRHILMVDQPDGEQHPGAAEAEPRTPFLRPLGRPFPPRRGH